MLLQCCILQWLALTAHVLSLAGVGVISVKFKDADFTRKIAI